MIEVLAIVVFVIIFVFALTKDNNRDPYHEDVPPDRDPRYLAALGRAVKRARKWTE
jgi:hypothetical protein